MNFHASSLPSLKTKTLGKTFFHFDNVDSTQTVAKQLLENGHTTGTCVLADRQSKGKGTKGRAWFSLRQSQIYLSFIMEKIFLPFAELPILNIALGICMVRTIRNLGVEGCFLKWPNDVYIQGKKVCGILSELISHDQKQFIISGIGVNYQGRPDEFPAELHGKAAILQAHAQNIPERTLFISNYFAEVEAYFDRVRQQGLAVIQKDFTELWIYKNHPISINDGHSTYEGVSDTIDAYGALLVQTKEDSFKRIFSADISPIKTKNVD